MRGIGLVVLVAVAVSACRSPPLVNRPDALGPSVVVRHVVEPDIEVPKEQAEGLDPGRSTDRAVPGDGSPVGRTTRRSRDRAGITPGTAAAEDVPDGVAVTAARAPGRARGEDYLASTDPPEPTEATAPGDAQDDGLAALPGQPTRTSTEQVEGERGRSATSTSPWPWVALALVLVVTAGFLTRRLRARSRLRSHRYDPDDAWDVFHPSRVGEEASGGRRRSVGMVMPRLLGLLLIASIACVACGSEDQDKNQSAAEEPFGFVPPGVFPDPVLPRSTLPTPSSSDPAIGSYKSEDATYEVTLGASGHYEWQWQGYPEYGSWHRVEKGILLHPLEWDGNMADGRKPRTLGLRDDGLVLRLSSGDISLDRQVKKK